MHVRWIAILTVVLLLAACAPRVQPPATPGSTAAPGAELTPVRLGVGYIPSVQFTPLYVGIAKGFYADAGLDVALEYGFENDYLKLVGTDALQFMIGSGDQVILGRAQGLPVRYVMNWYSTYPAVVFSRAELGIDEPQELAGKTIGIPGPFGANYVALRGILEAAGLTEGEVKLESIGFSQAAAVNQGTVDAAVDYGVNGPVVLAQEGVATTQIPLDRYLRIPANGLITNEATLAAQPDLVRSMVQATQRAIQYTLDNPDEAFAIALEFVPEAGGDNEAANRAVFDAVLDYWRPPAGGRQGETAPADWQAAADFMRRIGLVTEDVPADELFTNEFLSPE